MEITLNTASLFVGFNFPKCGLCLKCVLWGWLCYLGTVNNVIVQQLFKYLFLPPFFKGISNNKTKKNIEKKAKSLGV